MKEITLLALGCVALFVALTRLDAVIGFLGTLIDWAVCSPFSSTSP